MRLKDIDIIELYHTWQYNTGYFECFFRSAPFASLKNYSDFEIFECNLEKDWIFDELQSILNKFDKSKSLFLIDLPDSLTIKIAYLLNNHLCIKPILTFNFMLNDYGQVGSKEFVNNLIFCGKKLKKISPIGYAFILDYNRFSELDNINTLNMFNNQYEINEENVPDISMLQELGYANIIYLSLSGIKEDIKYYVDYLESENIKVSKFILQKEQ